jgi:hypothetical protein
VKVLVCGSRDWDQPMVIQHYLRQLPRVLGIADAMGYAVEEFPADWRGKGKRAGILRNLAMLDQQPDLVLAFQRDGSTGTQHTIDEARRRGVPVKVFSA